MDSNRRKSDSVKDQEISQDQIALVKKFEYQNWEKLLFFLELAKIF